MRAKFFGLFLVLALPATLGRVAGVSATTRAEDSQAQQAIIIDHTCTDLSRIPEYWIEQAKAQLRLSYGHTSHGSQPISGMGVLRDDLSYGGLYNFNTNGAIEGEVLSLHDRKPSDDLGHDGDTSWADRTRTYLDGSGTGSSRNVVVWSWCGGVSDNTEEGINAYLSAMNQLEAEYPDVTFVYMTGHLDGTGVDGDLNVNNNQIRAYCIANNKVLFDFADIESYDPDGNYYLDRGANDGCYYDDGGSNWADEWCAAHSGDSLCESCSCSHSRPLNCNLKARAFWWMLARLAGWAGAADWISVTAANDMASIHPGETATYTLSVTASEGFTAPVTLALQGEPSGTTVVFNPNPVTPPGNSQLSVTTAASTAAGTYAMTVAGTSGQVADATPLTLTINPTLTLVAQPDTHTILPGDTAVYTLSLTANEGLAALVDLTLQEAPAGTTVFFDPNPVTPPGDSQLSVTTAASTAAGNYAMTVTGTSGVLTDTANLTLIVASAAPSFTLSISPTTRIAGPNQVVSYTVVAAGVNGFSQPVSLTVVGLPTGVGVGWSVNPVTPGDSSILTLSIPGSPSFGNHPLQVVGTADMGTADMQVVAEGFELTITYPFSIYLPIILKQI